MKILFVIDRIELKYFEFNKLVTNFWLIKEFLEKGQNVYITTIDKLGLNSGVPYTKCSKSYIKNNDIFYHKEFEKKNIEEFNLVMFRPDPPVDLDYINATYIFDFVDREKTCIMNDTKTIRDFNEKLHAVLFNEYMPKNIVTSSKEDIKEFLNENDEIILKPLNRCFGAGVMYLSKTDKNITSIINTMTNNETTLVMVQKYIPLGIHGDKRVLILDGEVMDECIIKLPPSDDFKFNNHCDEYIKKAVLTDKEKSDFTAIAQGLKHMGIIMAGLDVIDGKIIEINVTSPCYFIKEINERFDTEIEHKIVDKILNIISRKKQIICNKI